MWLTDNSKTGEHNQAEPVNLKTFNLDKSYTG